MIDILLVALFAFIVYRAAKRGFVATILSASTWILAILIAGQLSAGVATSIYYSTIHERVEKTIEARMPDMTEASLAVDYAQGVVENIPQFLINSAENTGVDTQALIKDFDNVKLDKEVISAELAEKVVAPIFISIFKLFTFFILGILLFILLRVLFKFIDKIFKLPLINKTNQILGGLLGAVKAVFIVGTISVALYIIIGFGADNWLTNAADESIIIGYLRSSDFINNILG
ncbi:MAG TPA: CvpA family protein [Clostridia bacterium]|nr:CvpA family protein [Clostridia bacterium]